MLILSLYFSYHFCDLVDAKIAKTIIRSGPADLFQFILSSADLISDFRPFIILMCCRILSVIRKQHLTITLNLGSVFFIQILLSVFLPLPFYSLLMSIDSVLLLLLFSCVDLLTRCFLSFLFFSLTHSYFASLHLLLISVFSVRFSFPFPSIVCCPLFSSSLDFHLPSTLSLLFLGKICFADITRDSPK